MHPYVGRAPFTQNAQREIGGGESQTRRDRGAVADLREPTGGCLFVC